jgi:hypothetical protein
VSQFRRLRIDVYGRFSVDVIRRQGRWEVFRLGDDGKRSRITDLPLTGTAAPEDVVLAVDAVFHELAGPGDELRVVDIQVG